MGHNGSTYDYVIHVALIATYVQSCVLLITRFQPPFPHYRISGNDCVCVKNARLQDCEWILSRNLLSANNNNGDNFRT